MKKAIAIILALVLTLSAVSFAAAAEEEIQVIFDEDNKYAELIIPEKIDGKPVTELTGEMVVEWMSPYSRPGRGYFAVDYGGENFLTKITIPKSVTSIEEDVFYECIALKEIVVDPYNEKYASADGALYSKDMTKLIRVPRGRQGEFAIPEGVKTIEAKAFLYCAGITGVTMPDGVTSIGERAFKDCSALESITIPDGVTSIGDNAFERCYALESITIGGGVTSIGDNAFERCSALESITIPKGVTSIGERAFFLCYKLSKIEVDAANENYASIDGALFTKDLAELIVCPPQNEAELTVPEGTKTIKGMAFYNCSKLAGVILPESLTTLERDSFYSCKSLKSIDIGANVSVIGEDAFAFCTGLAAINVAEENENYCSIDGLLYSKNKQTLIHCPYMKEGEVTVAEGVTYINNLAYRSKITKITLPDSISRIGDRAFASCKALKSINIPESVTSIGDGAFEGCAKLADIALPESVTSIGDGAFESCAKLKSVNLPDSLKYIGDEVFMGCISLTGVTIPKGVTYIGYRTFAYCDGLKSVTIPEGVKIIAGGAFSGCDSLTSVNIPASAEEIDDEAFERCYGLREIIVSPENKTYASVDGVVVTKDMTEIVAFPSGKADAFTIPDGVKDIGYRVFENAVKLSSITIPASLEEIDIWDFAECRSLREINVDKNNANYASVDGALYSKDKTRLILVPGGKASLTIPKSVKTIDAEAFSPCRSLQEINVDKNNANYASVDGVLFSKDMKKLIAFPCARGGAYVIPDGVTGIAYPAFLAASKLTSLTIPASVTDISSSFIGLTKLMDIYYLGSEKQWKNIGLSLNYWTY